MSKFPYPKCIVNPRTQLPYTSHKFEICQTPDGRPLLLELDGHRLYYHIVCERCDFNDPKKERY